MSPTCLPVSGDTFFSFSREGKTREFFPHFRAEISWIDAESRCISAAAVRLTALSLASHLTRSRILERHFQSRFLGINLCLFGLEFCLVFYLIFPFYKILFMNRFKFFVLQIFLTREEYGFL